MWSVQEIVKLIPFSAKLIGNTDVRFSEIVSLQDDHENALIWIKTSNPDASRIAAGAKASIIICHTSLRLDVALLSRKCLIQVEQPEIAFLRLTKALKGTQKKISEIHPTALIDPDARIGDNVSIGPFVTIGKCHIGRNSIISRGCTIHDDVSIGENVLIYEYCNIGGQGFGHIKNENNQLENMLHIGKVVIEDDVEIFPYGNVDKGTLGTTKIGRGTKIDHYCHIGHNTETGSNCVITAKVVLAGSSKVGRDTFLGVGTVVKEGKIIGNNCIIGMGSIVTKDVPDGQTWAGNPAMPLSDLKKLSKK